MIKSTRDKLIILAESAKYDVSCSSSGTKRPNQKQGIGSASSSGICHSFTEDGRCVALFKILLTNFCLYDCAYCINRRSNDIERAAFSPKELANLIIEFYRRNYIEGLFLSSGIIKNADHTMEKMLQVVKLLRNEYGYNGYIHLKVIPGTSEGLLQEAGLYADRLSINLEIPTEPNLKLLAPEKDHQSIYKPMHHIQQYALENKEDRNKGFTKKYFAPAGQSTQLIVGATNETDKEILSLTSVLYRRPMMKRVYYSGFIPVNEYDKRLPVVHTDPRQRENRLYQADWLLRFYHFAVDEIVNDTFPYLDLEIDPKLAWALRHPHFFPVDVNRDSHELLLRVPGIGIKSAKLIVMARRHSALRLGDLKRMGVVLKRAQFFITCLDKLPLTIHEAKPENIRLALTNKPKVISTESIQLGLLF